MCTVQKNNNITKSKLQDFISNNYIKLGIINFLVNYTQKCLKIDL